jgi:hypothetical protein
MQVFTMRKLRKFLLYAIPIGLIVAYLANIWISVFWSPEKTRNKLFLEVENASLFSRMFHMESNKYQYVLYKKLEKWPVKFDIQFTLEKPREFEKKTVYYWKGSETEACLEKFNECLSIENFDLSKYNLPSTITIETLFEEWESVCKVSVLFLQKNYPENVLLWRTNLPDY